MNRLFPFVFLLLWQFARAALPVQPPATKKSTCTPPSVSADYPPTLGLFGVSQRLPSIAKLRGGAVQTPESLQDMESIVLRAGSEGKLIVVDFTATW